jgi:pyruvate carboxylase
MDMDALNQYADYWEIVRTYYAPFDEAPKSGTAEVYLHEMPGGQYTNLKAQAESMGLAERWPEIARTYADVNRAFGDIVKVTPSSKVVGDMAIFLVTHGMTMHEFERMDENHNLTLPNSVVELFEGALGIPMGGWPKKLQKTILKGRKAGTGRPGAHLAPINFEETVATLESKIGRKPGSEEVLSYLMYPDVFTKFAKAANAYGDLDVVPTPQFFYGMKTGQEITVEIEPGKKLIVKFLTVSDARPDGHRTVFFELNGQPREVNVRDASIRATDTKRELADPAIVGQVGAPTPGMIAAVAVELNQPVRKGDRLLIMEAMKMQTTIYAPIDGKITKKLAHAGQTVEAKELLLVIEP